MSSPIGPKWNIRRFFSENKKDKAKKEKSQGFFGGLKKLFSPSKSPDDLSVSKPWRVTPEEETISSKARLAYKSFFEPHGDRQASEVELLYIDNGQIVADGDQFFSIAGKVVSDRIEDKAQKREVFEKILEALDRPYRPSLAHVPGKYFFEAEEFHTINFIITMEKLDFNISDNIDEQLVLITNKRDREFATVLVNKDRYKALSDALQVPLYLYQVDREGNLTGIEMNINHHLKGDPIHIGFPVYPFNE